MDLSNLKSSLFGYNKLAVSNYVSGLESESNQKVQDLQKAAKETEDTLRSQIEELRTKYEEEVQKLNEKIDALTEERDLLRRDNDTIADTDEDSSITIIDATYIQRWLENLQSNDKIGKPLNK